MTTDGGRSKARLAAWPAIAALCALFLGFLPHTAAAQPTAGSYDYSNSYEVVIGVGKSQVIQLPTPYTDVMIADPKIADILPLNTRSLYVVGKSVGATALTIYGPGKRLIAAVNVVISADIESFKSRLHEILPNEKDIAIRAANQSIVLSGTASSPVVLQQILTLADTYAPGKVVNMMTVEGTQQVMLSVRFVEMERTLSKNLRLNVDINAGEIQAGTDPVTGNPLRKFNFVTGDNLVNAAGALIDSFGGAVGLFSGADGDVTLLFDALESKGMVKTLAEPSLVAQSGDTANFLAGGEFPIPVAQSTGTAGTGNAITVEFKQFGVSLAFTPTILKDGLINLVVDPEVSSIDAANSVTSGGIRIPGIKARRAHTTVELRDGESFVIAGLLKEDYADEVRQFPWLGDIPIIGALFRSTGFQRSETELVIVVTPHLVTPRRGTIATPADHFVPLSDFELFVVGTKNGSDLLALPRDEDRALMSGQANRGGIEGPHGHVVY